MAYIAWPRVAKESSALDRKYAKRPFRRPPGGATDLSAIRLWVPSGLDDRLLPIRLNRNAQQTLVRSLRIARQALQVQTNCQKFYYGRCFPVSQLGLQLGLNAR
jgi:hypothetical protein